MAAPNSNSCQQPALGLTTCRHMLSKGMYVSGMLDPADHVHGPMSDGYCWCALNQCQIGPDGQLVERIACQPGRVCHESR